MAEDSPAILTTIEGAIAVIRFNQPHLRNPLSTSTLSDLRQSLTDVMALEEVKVIIFTGTADIFASGANIRELAQLTATSALQFSQLGQQLFQTIAEAPQLTIAAINGYCMGGALDLALACDLRVASEIAVFAHPGARLGIITGWGGTQRLPRLVAKSVALELFLTARRLTSTEALRVGLITSVSQDALLAALSLARTHVTKPTKQ